jgi:hypothetical protein
MTRPLPPARSSEQGSAILIAIGASSLLAALGFGLLTITNTETTAAAEMSEGQELSYAADAGLERAIADLKLVPWSQALSGGALSSFRDVGTPVRPTGEPINLAARTQLIQVEAASLWAAAAPVWRLYGYGPMSLLAPGASASREVYVAVWIADDPYETDANPAADSNATVLLRATALGKGRAERTLSATVAHVGPGAMSGQAPSQGGIRVISWREKR